MFFGSIETDQFLAIFFPHRIVIIVSVSNLPSVVDLFFSHRRHSLISTCAFDERETNKKRAKRNETFTIGRLLFLVVFFSCVCFGKRIISVIVTRA